MVPVAPVDGIVPELVQVEPTQEAVRKEYRPGCLSVVPVRARFAKRLWCPFVDHVRVLLVVVVTDEEAVELWPHHCDVEALTSYDARGRLVNLAVCTVAHEHYPLPSHALQHLAVTNGNARSAG